MNQATKTAISYTRRGWYVFPIQPGSKFPYKDFHWTTQSTNDPEKVKEASEHPNYKACNWAIDCKRSGLFVIDVDPRHGGQESYDAFVADPDAPLNTGMRNSTPQGGQHLYFKGVGPNSTNKLAPGIDTRGPGYVLIPGSVTEHGVYKVIVANDPIPLPHWVTDRLGTPKDKVPPEEYPDFDQDTEINIERAKRYLKDHAPEAVRGSRDDTCYKVACHLRDLGVSADISKGLMLEHYLDKVDLSSDFGQVEVVKKVDSAWVSALGAPGSKTPEAIFPTAPSEGAGPLSTQQVKYIADFLLTQHDPRRWLMGHRYIPGYIINPIKIQITTLIHNKWRFLRI